MGHHTKDKGDRAVGEVIADLMRAGVHVCLPLSEHLPFDLVAISPSLRQIRRVQVRYASLRKGAVRIYLQGTHADRHGVHHRRFKIDEVDSFGIFCPETNQVYYVLSDELRGHQTLFSIRVIKSRNGQIVKTKPWTQFIGAARVFGPVAQMDEPGASNS